LGNGRPVRFCRTGSRGEQEACFHRQRPRRGGFDYVVTAAQDLIRGTAYNAAVVPGVENTTMQQLQLVSFVLAMAALVVYGCIFTRKPRKILPMDTLRPAVPDEHQPSCFALEEERGGDWKGSGRTLPSIKEAKPSL
jgi:hypothetical protein